MYCKETLELEDIRQMFHNNELMKKTDSTEEPQDWLSRAIRVDQRVGDSKGIQRLLTVFLIIVARNQGASTKIVWKYKEILKKKGGKDSNGSSTSEKSDQIGIVEQADENPCDILTTQSGKDKYSDAWLLDSGCTYYMCPKRKWFNTYKPYDAGSVLMGNDVVCKTIGIGDIRMRIFNGYVRTLINMRHVPRFKEESSLARSFGSSRVQVFRCKLKY